VKQQNKALLTKYLVCFGIASLLAFIVFWIKGFFAHSLAVNIQVLADGFTVSGLLLTLFAGMMFISGEGALIGISFVLRNVVQAFVPMGRRHHEVYAKYRERKLGEVKKSGDHCVLIAGLTFLFIGVLFTVIWYVNFYQMPV
jgi:hypothetical protein